MNFLKSIFNSILLAGIIILVIGFYYMVIKAGILYQDPTPELQLQYSIDMGIGDVLTTVGLCTTMAGAVCRMIIGFLSREKKAEK